jgi:hypothetical protein
MALVTVYDPDGNPVDVEPVDAREYIEHCGYTREAQKVKEPEQPKPTRKR